MADLSLIPALAKPAEPRCYQVTGKVWARLLSPWLAPSPAQISGKSYGKNWSNHTGACYAATSQRLPRAPSANAAFQRHAAGQATGHSNSTALKGPRTWSSSSWSSWKVAHRPAKRSQVAGASAGREGKLPGLRPRSRNPQLPEPSSEADLTRSEFFKSRK